MHNTLNTPGILVVAFASLGFMTKEAFMTICKDLDKSVSQWDLNLFYDFGIFAEGMLDRLNDILELLKYE